MTDILICDVPDTVIAALDTHAARLGLSRSEYVRRRPAQEAAVEDKPATVENLSRFSGAVLRFAWLRLPTRPPVAWVGWLGFQD